MKIEIGTKLYYLPYYKKNSDEPSARYEYVKVHNIQNRYDNLVS